MNKSSIAKAITVLTFAFVGWAICGAIMGIGRAVTSLENTLDIHAIGAPIVFGTLSLIYFKRFNYTTPLRTAIAFLAFVVFMDVFLIALFVEKSFAMFASILGTWIPFTLIFLSAYLTGLYLEKAGKQTAVGIPSSTKG
ncbi:MAG: hypothetical protein HY782_08560 [Chloroflexi bacterium]|nr:hypothetical protein [Chloroflexota bacterium]